MKCIQSKVNNVLHKSVSLSNNNLIKYCLAYLFQILRHIVAYKRENN